MSSSLQAAPDFLCLDPVLVSGLGVELTSIEVVQLLVRFAGRTGAQLIATGVREQAQHQLLARNGVELFCGEAFARADTRLPQVRFSGVSRCGPIAGAARWCAQAVWRGESRSPATPVKMVTRLRPRRLLS